MPTELARPSGIPQPRVLSKIKRYEGEEDYVLSDVKILIERYKRAILFFRTNLIAFCTTIALKEYLLENGAKQIGIQPIGFSGEEFATRRTLRGVLAGIVDAVQGHPLFTFQLDPYDVKTGDEVKVQVGIFVKKQSILPHLSNISLPKKFFDNFEIIARPKKDTDELLRRAFIPALKDVNMTPSEMGNVIYLLWIRFKENLKLLKNVVLKSKNSIESLFFAFVGEVREAGWVPPVDATGPPVSKRTEHTEIFETLDKLQPNEIKIINNIGIYYDSTSAIYDKFTPLKLHPQLHYMIILSNHGIVTITRNPYCQPGINQFNLGTIAQNCLRSIMTELQKQEISLAQIKKFFDTTSGMHQHYNFSDLSETIAGAVQATFPHTWRFFITDVIDKNYKSLSVRKKMILDKIKVNMFDLILMTHKGEKDTSETSGWMFGGKIGVKLMLLYAKKLAYEMKDRVLWIPQTKKKNRTGFGLNRYPVASSKLQNW